MSGTELSRSSSIVGGPAESGTSFDGRGRGRDASCPLGGGCQRRGCAGCVLTAAGAWRRPGLTLLLLRTPAAAKRVLSAPDSAESSAKVWLDCLQAGACPRDGRSMACHGPALTGLLRCRMVAAEPPRKLALIYVANEIVQRGRKAHGNLVRS